MSYGISAPLQKQHRISWQPPHAPARPLSAAERNRQRRCREKHGISHIHGLDMPLQAVAALVDLGSLDERQFEDRRSVRAASERYMNETLLAASGELFG